MPWLASADVALFRLVNDTMSAGWLDRVMPWLSWNSLFVPALVLTVVLLLVKGGTRGRVLVGMLVVSISLTDATSNLLKHTFNRPRPFAQLERVHLLAGQGTSASMPSSHAANWFAAVAVMGLFYRRSRRWMIPVACAVSYSRMYIGVHFPSDVLVGGLLGFGVGWLVPRFLDRLWGSVGRRLFPIWWRHLPRLTSPEWNPDALAPRPDLPPLRDPDAIRERQWLYAGYVMLVAVLLGRIGYLAAGKIELTEDEAYQWMWSKHLDLSYFSKPPLIAYAQFLGRSLWGDTEFGVRFLSPVISSLLGVMVLRFMAKQVGAFAGFCVLLMLTASPMMAAGSILMTIDCLSVLFWTAAVIAGWSAVRRPEALGPWVLLGLSVGFGFLAKYTAMLQWICFACFFAWHKPARRCLRVPGLWIAVAISLAMTAPVLIWNVKHGWITVTHLQDRAGLSTAWRPTTRFLLDFSLAELGLLNPVFFVGMLCAVWFVFKARRGNALLSYLVAMGVPLFLGYWLYTLRARVQPNWIVPSVIPLFCLTVICAESPWKQGKRWVRRALFAGLGLGLPLVVLLHDTNLVAKAIGMPLPPKYDPLRRARGWTEGARIVAQARGELEREGKPAFVIGDHYGTTSLLSFYIPEERRGVPNRRSVYFHSNPTPMNQYFFWEGYTNRLGQNAVFVSQATEIEAAPETITAEFESVTDLGLHDVVYRGRVLRKLQLFACRNYQYQGTSVRR